MEAGTDIQGKGNPSAWDGVPRPSTEGWDAEKP